MAPDGAAPSVAPGDTFGGTGSHCSVSSGLAAAGGSAARASLDWGAPAAISARPQRESPSFFIRSPLVSGMRRPGRLTRRVRNAGIKSARRLDISHRLGAADLGREVAEQGEFLHHAKVGRGFGAR